MTARLPSLNGLRAFEAAARHLSFTNAASELNVTQTAISHQIRRLEQELGVHLFVRQNRALTLTPADPALAAPHAFFRRLRQLTIGGYYTTKPGFKDIGYIGNVAMKSYPGPSDEVKAVLERELKKLGL